MNNFSQEEIKNILALISKAPITGEGALTVALLQQKLAKLLEPEEVKDEKKPE